MKRFKIVFALLSILAVAYVAKIAFAAAVHNAVTEVVAGFIEVDEANGVVRIGDLNGINGGGVISAGAGNVEIDGGDWDGVFITTTSPNGLEIRTGGVVLIPGLPTSEPVANNLLYRNGGNVEISD